MQRSFVLAALALTGLSFFQTAPAQAAGCYYGVFQDGRGYIGIRGVGHAAKHSWACDRARRECNRRLERARKRGELPRGGPRDFRCSYWSS